MSYWYMSFVDPDGPPGDRFLGALIIEAEDQVVMLKKSHRLQLNPGGEVMFFQIPEEFASRIPRDWIDRRLISREELNELEMRYGEAPH